MNLPIEAQPLTLESGQQGVIRAGLPDDARKVLEITRQVIHEGNFVVTEPGEFSLGENQEREWLENHLHDPGHLILVAEIEKEVVGFLHFQTGYRKRLQHRGHFHMLILEAWRGKGVGSKLLSAVLDWTEKNPDIEKVSFAVFSNNEGAISLYRKFGFVEEGRRIREIKMGPDQYVDEILMYKWVQKTSATKQSP